MEFFFLDWHFHINRWTFVPNYFWGVCFVCLGSSFTKVCRVFVPSDGLPIVDVVWIAKKQFVFTTQPSDRIYTAEQQSEPSTLPSFLTACKTTFDFMFPY